MDYEKKYKEALDNFKKIKAANKDNKELVNFIEYEYPELKKSEDGMIIDAIKHGLKCLGWEHINGIRIVDIVAWLEKQGENHIVENNEKVYATSEQIPANSAKTCKDEQNPIDKVEPTFKTGDWVIWDNKISCHVDDIYQGKESLMYTITDTNNMIRSYSVKGFDNNAHLWTIQDAKEGDVLYSPCHSLLWIFKSKDTVYCGCNLNYNDGAFCGEGYFKRPTDAIPATKEQRDTLFAKMKEAGYEWDANEKELKKIVQETEPTPIFRVGDTLKRKGKDYTFIVYRIQGGYYHCYHSNGAFFPIEEQDNWELVEPKHTWSEEDEEIIKEACKIINCYGNIITEQNEANKAYRIADKLKSLKDRI